MTFAGQTRDMTGHKRHTPGQPGALSSIIIVIIITIMSIITIISTIIISIILMILLLFYYYYHSRRELRGKHSVRDWRQTESPYTRSPLQDSRLFGPSPWKILAATYKNNDF